MEQPRADITTHSIEKPCPSQHPFSLRKAPQSFCQICARPSLGTGLTGAGHYMILCSGTRVGNKHIQKQTASNPHAHSTGDRISKM